MKIFFHLALDRFGAEVLGRLQQYLADLDSAEAGQDDEHEARHEFVWAGGGPAPSDPGWWERRFPRWTAQLQIAEAGGGLDCDRAAVAEATQNGGDGEPTLEKQLLETLETRRRNHVGNLPAEEHVQLVASLADPVGGARLLAALRAFESHRAQGNYQRPARVFLGLGILGSELIEAGRSPVEVRALVARGLLDLQSWLSAEGRALERAVPVHVIGEDSIEGQVPDHQSQVALGAMGLLAATRSQIAGQSATAGLVVNPFHFAIDSDGRIVETNRPWKPEAPFSALGGFLVSCPTTRLTELLAAELCGELFERLSRQDPVGPIEHAAQVGDQRLHVYLDQEQAKTIGDVQQRVRAMTGGPVGADSETDPRWLSLSQLELLYGPIFEGGDWLRIVDNYGRDRMVRIPLEDWNGALDELSLVVDEGFIHRRKARVNQVTRRMLHGFLESLDAGVDRIFQRSFQDPVDFEPHRAALVYLGRTLASIERERSLIEREIAVDTSAKGEDPAKRPLLEKLRCELDEALRAVPSPAAVFLRMVPVLAATCGIVAGIPTPLGPLEPVWIRLLLGLALGACINGLFFHFYVRRIRHQLLLRFDEWFDHHKLVLAREDELLRREAFDELLKDMAGVVRWAYDGGVGTPPIPPAFDFRWRRKAAEGDGEEDAENLSRKSVMRGYREYLEKARDRYRAIRKLLQDQFQPSGVERVLPDIHAGASHALEREVRRVLDEEVDATSATDPVKRDRALLELARSMRAWCVEHRPTDSFISRPLPFLRAEQTERNVRLHPMWRRSFQTPSDEDLLSDELRLDSSGFGFFDTVSRYLHSNHMGSFRLGRRLQEYCQLCEATTIFNTPLRNEALQLGIPSVLSTSAESFGFAIGHTHKDPFVGEQALANDQGRDRLSVQLRLNHGLSAEQVVAFPNLEQPSNALGKAWKTVSEQEGELPKALEPLVATEEVPS